MTSTALVRLGEQIAAQATTEKVMHPAVPLWLILIVVVGFLALTKTRGTRRWE